MNQHAHCPAEWEAGLREEENGLQVSSTNDLISHLFIRGQDRTYQTNTPYAVVGR